eukprot:GHVT01067418.1.p4 GENE.GHVT01067418.1~~GHVT01067418.1.p4  ORF type:complete len:117 (-),score=15.35 GHVT01067418.1:807-1157(-)
MASGMGVHEDCVTEFTALKIRKTAKWMIFNIANDKVSLEKKGLGDSQEFKSHLPNDDCRFGVYDLDHKIQFVLWCPDTAPVKARMIYATSKDALVKKLDGVTPVALEAHEMADIKF